MTHPIPRPQILDPGRELEHDRNDMTLEEHRARAQRLADALNATCEYGQMLWLDVARAREYLMSSLPPDPRRPGRGGVSASPTGPDDDDGWQRWTDAYTELTSVLAGPHGDSGFGSGEARNAVNLRRNAPASRLRAKYPQIGAAGLQHQDAGDEAQHQTARPAPFTAAPATAPASTQAPAPAEATAPVEAPAPESNSGRWVQQAKPYLFGVLLVLAARGLRPGAREL